MITKTKLSPTVFLMLIVSLRPRLLRKTNAIKETVEKAIQALESMPLKWQRKTRIRLKI